MIRNQNFINKEVISTKVLIKKYREVLSVHFVV